MIDHLITYNIQISSHERRNQSIYTKSSYNRHCNFHRHVDREPPPPAAAPVLAAIPGTIAAVSVVVVVVVVTAAFCCRDRLLTGPTANASVGGGAIKDVVLVMIFAPTPEGRP